MAVSVQPPLRKLYPGNMALIVHRTFDPDLVWKAVVAEALTHHEQPETPPAYLADALCRGKIEAFRLGVSRDGLRDNELDNEDRYVTAGYGADVRGVVPVYVGNDVQWLPAKGGNDTWVCPRLSLEFRERTKSDEYPHGAGLGTEFLHRRMKLTADQGYAARTAERRAGNKPIDAIFGRLNATMGQPGESGVWLVKGMPPDMQKRKRHPIEVCDLGTREGDVQPHIFGMSWCGENKERIAAAVYDDELSFMRKWAPRVQLVNNRRLPDPETLKDVLASFMKAISEEVTDRAKSSGGNDWNIDADNMLMCINDLNKQRYDETTTGEPVMGLALECMGAERRKFGKEFSLPFVTFLRDIPAGILELPATTAAPYVVTRRRQSH